MLATLLASGLLFLSNHWQVDAAAQPVLERPPAEQPESLRGQRRSDRREPGPAIVAYVRPEFAKEMRALRATILVAAQRHNRPELSGLSDHEFAVVIAQLMYNEHFGWFEEKVPPVQVLTPLYERLQVQANQAGGSNLSIWPANLRPSVALEILRQEIPVPAPTLIITESIAVAGSQVRLDTTTSQSALYAAITKEIAQPSLAVEYLAANLERGLYRARFEGVPVTWQTLAAWHNQGIVSPKNIRDNPTARDYIRRSSAYLATARELINTPPARPCIIQSCRPE